MNYTMKRYCVCTHAINQALAIINHNFALLIRYKPGYFRIACSLSIRYGVFPKNSGKTGSPESSRSG